MPPLLSPSHLYNFTLHVCAEIFHTINDVPVGVGVPLLVHNTITLLNQFYEAS